MHYVLIFFVLVLVVSYLRSLLRRRRREDFFESHMNSYLEGSTSVHTSWHQIKSSWNTDRNTDSDDEWGEVTDLMTVASKVGVMEDPLYPVDTPSIDANT
jgi:hypothetical protein